MNVVGFLSLTMFGDDKNVYPFLSTYKEDFVRMDVSKLAQWQIVLEHGCNMGLLMHMKHQEHENDQKLDGGRLDVQRKTYYRELIARFGHLLALQWNLGEENTNTYQQSAAYAKFFYDNDPYRSPLVIHAFPSIGHQEAIFRPFIGNPHLSGLSIQVRLYTLQNVKTIPSSLAHMIILYVRDSSTGTRSKATCCFGYSSRTPQL